VAIALNVNAMTTLAFAKSYLKIPSLVTTDDDIVSYFINAASDELERQCDRKLKAQSITEVQHGRGQNIIQLREFPVNSITSLRLDRDGVFTDPSTLIPATSYAIADHGNCLLYKHATFPKGYNNIQVVYNAGYSTLPSDIEHACLWLVFWYYKIRNAEDIGRTSKTKEGETVSYLQEAPQMVKNAILAHKRTEFPGSNSLLFNV
jgi:uncharacterized phiE125 gp8 family phage protein